MRNFGKLAFLIGPELIKIFGDQQTGRDVGRRKPSPRDSLYRFAITWHVGDLATHETCGVARDNDPRRVGAECDLSFRQSRRLSCV